MVCFVSAIDDPSMAFTIRHRRTDEKLELLAQLPPFCGWGRARITDLGRNAELCTVPAGTRLQAQGALVSQWICVVRGVAVRTVDGEPVAVLPAGSCWGTFRGRSCRSPRKPGGSLCRKIENLFQ